MVSLIKTWRREKSGATAIEYSLIAAGIAFAIVGGVFAFGDALVPLFDELVGWLP